MSDIPFEAFPKISRLSRPCVITEKIDGTNAQIFISDDLSTFMVGSRNQWLSAEADNFGFHRWAMEHKDELMKLGAGRHFGEWWGSGIQRGYGLKEKRFSLFNTHRWNDDAVRPACCHVVPIIDTCNLDNEGSIYAALGILAKAGSLASPGFMQPEGIVLYHAASNQLFKKTILKDEEHKSMKANQ